MQKHQAKEIESLVTFLSPRYKRRSLKLKPLDFHRKNNVSFGAKTPDQIIGLEYAEKQMKKHSPLSNIGGGFFDQKSFSYRKASMDHYNHF